MTKMSDALVHDPKGGMPRLLEIMARLRDPQTGCPWDVEQSFATIAPYTIEEAYEVADAIEREAWDELKGELGDLLFQSVFHAQMAAEAAALMADREPGDVQFDEESGEGDTIAVERDRDLALSAAARQSVAEIDAALERLDNGTYGMCMAGDDIIPKERLEAIPEASVCVKHKTSMF